MFHTHKAPKDRVIIFTAKPNFRGQPLRLVTGTTGNGEIMSLSGYYIYIIYLFRFSVLRPV